MADADTIDLPTDPTPPLAWVGMLSAAAVVASATTMAGGRLAGLGLCGSLAIVLSACAGLTDAASWRISNRLTYPGVLLGPALALAAVAVDGLRGPAYVGRWIGSPGLVEAVVAAGVWFGALLPLWAMRMLGGGDMKLLVALGAILGVRGSLLAGLWALPPAMAMAVLNVLSGGGFTRRLSLTSLRLLPAPLAVAPRPGAAFARRVPLGPAVCAGVVLACLVRQSWLDWLI